MRDVVIVGGGPAGLSFARSIAGLGLTVSVIERSSVQELLDPPPDGREIALTHASTRILKSLKVWDRIDPEAISIIKVAKVLDGNSAFALEFQNSSDAGAYLGHLVPNHLIRRALFAEVLTQPDVEVVAGVSVSNVRCDEHGAQVSLDNGDIIAARLVVAADSRFSSMRRMMGIPASMHDFSRVAIVCRMSHEKSHEQTALECFHYGRTLAVLPMVGNVSSVVITVSADTADTILNMSEDLFNLDIQQRLDGRLGSMTLLGKRWAYPLVAVHAKQFVATRFALIGDAAVGMHPVTAHGFNLGLAGQDMLAKEIERAVQAARDIGADNVLSRYQKNHMRVTLPMYAATNGIVKLFTNDEFPARILRKFVMHVGQHFPPIKRIVTNRLTEAVLR